MPAQEKTSTLKTRDVPVEVVSVRQIKILLSWKAPSRVFKRRGRDFWTTVGSIAFLVAIILFFIKEWLLIIVVAALIFVYYILSSVAPEEIEHQITTRGVRMAGKEYPWEVLGRYWFAEKWDQKVLYIEVVGLLPGRLELLLDKENEEEAQDILVKYLVEEIPPSSFLERASDWLSKKIPLEIGK